MSFEFVPWPNFADRMLNELNSGGGLCDLMIGDSQWIGGAAENGHYIKLNDFFAKEGIDKGDFIPATVTGYSEWPNGRHPIIGLCRHLGIQLAGLTVKTGSSVLNFGRNIRQNTGAI